MNQYGRTPSHYSSSNARERAAQAEHVELMLFALGGGMTLLLTAAAMVLSISQVA